MPWITPEEVRNITGLDLDEPEKTIAVASEVIGLHVGLIPGDYTLAGKDGLILKRAVAFECPFVEANPDLFEMKDVSSAGQDGQSASFKAHAHTLAPLAKLALRRLSWRGTRSVSSEPATKRIADDDDLDGRGRPLPWEPLR